MIVLSARQAKDVLSALGRGCGEASVSLDLGRSEGSVGIGGGYVKFPDGQRLGTALLQKVEEGSCYLVRGSRLFRIQLFSPDTRKVYTLVSTEGAPTFSISGIRMHQTKDYSPIEDAAMKVKALKPLDGRRVLDTCMGLGYSAIAALKAGALEVTTVEADGSVIELAKVNPWSSELWSDARVRAIKGDVSETVHDFDKECFDRVIHDPPRVTMAGELYGLEFYRQLHRVLKPGGLLFHYVGRPGGRFRNRRVEKGVVERLRSAGFSGIRKLDNLQGVRAVRG